MLCRRRKKIKTKQKRKILSRCVRLVGVWLLETGVVFVEHEGEYLFIFVVVLFSLFV